MKSIPMLLLALAFTSGAATPKINWAPKSDRGFDQAMEQGKFVLQLFVQPRCPECGLFEKTALKDPDVAAMIEDHFVAIRSDVGKPEGKADAENYAVETFPTILFFNSRGQQIDAAMLKGATPTADFLKQLLDITSGKFAQQGTKGLLLTTGEAVRGATASTTTTWSKPDTSAKIAPPPLPDTSSQVPR